MNKIVLILLLIFAASGCDLSKSKISEEQARAIVVKHHYNNIGKIKIISVNHENGEYQIKWDNKENCESGTYYVDDKSGKIIKGEASIC
ncbi:PepSY domain-containing protein [Bacillus sp. NEB1478]|uniref:PepSY domain-containing protein n=1 Tax=Bacillus sp. NEB1478 TaxID=3073816 RepID=UPI0028737B8D|nr:PepSY domain-containing protein [Bacillus sp. NEB1478]WNB92990.1 PepSY domain-containing protein [Bacillus sp. NEB1478]